MQYFLKKIDLINPSTLSPGKNSLVTGQGQRVFSHIQKDQSKGTSSFLASGVQFITVIEKTSTQQKKGQIPNILALK